MKAEILFFHSRNLNPIIKNPNNPKGIETKGGVTIATYQEKDILFVAGAVCSNFDNYNKKIGRSISEGRLHKFINNNELTDFTFKVKLKDGNESIFGVVDSIYVDTGWRSEKPYTRISSNSFDFTLTNGV